MDHVSPIVFMDLAHVWSYLLVRVFSCVPLMIFPSFPSSCSSCSSQDPFLSWKISRLGSLPYIRELTSFASPSLLFVCCFCRISWRSTNGTFWTWQDFRYALQNYYWPRCFATSAASPTDVLHVTKLSLKLNPMAFACLYQFHINHGKILGRFCTWIA